MLSRRLQQRRQATRVVEVFHKVFAAGADVGEERRRARKAIKVVKRDLNASAIGEGDKVYDGIGGTAESEYGGDGILKRGITENVARLQVLPDHFHDSPPRVV